MRSKILYVGGVVLSPRKLLSLKGTLNANRDKVQNVLQRTADWLGIPDLYSQMIYT